MARDIGEGVWVERGIPRGEVSTAEHIETCKDLLLNHYLPIVKIHELFIPDVEKTVTELEQRLRSGDVSNTGAVLTIVQDPEHRRLMSRVNLDSVISVSSGQDISETLTQFRQDLQCLVSAKISEVSGHLRSAVDNIAAGASYQHVDTHGPRVTRVSVREDEELVAPYFTSPDLDTLEQEAELCWSPQVNTEF